MAAKCELPHEVFNWTNAQTPSSDWPAFIDYLVGECKYALPFRYEWRVAGHKRCYGIMVLYDGGGDIILVRDCKSIEFQAAMEEAEKTMQAFVAMANEKVVQ